MHRMNHEELALRLEQRLDKIERKLDKYLEVITAQEADLRWVKGYIKLSLAAGIALAGGLLSIIVKMFII